MCAALYQSSQRLFLLDPRKPDEAPNQAPNGYLILIQWSKSSYWPFQGRVTGHIESNVTILVIIPYPICIIPSVRLGCFLQRGHPSRPSESAFTTTSSAHCTPRSIDEPLRWQWSRRNQISNSICRRCLAKHLILYKYYFRWTHCTFSASAKVKIDGASFWKKFRVRRQLQYP